MEPYSDNELSLALEAVRPTPAPAFAAELDARAAAGFPRRSSLGELSPVALLERLRGMKPRQVLLPAGAVAVTALLAVGIVVSQVGDSKISYSSGDATTAEMAAPESSGETGFLNGYSGGSDSSSKESASPAPEYQADDKASAGTVYESAGLGGPGSATAQGEAAAAGHGQRSIERSAEMTLGTAPEDVGKASGEVFDVVHTYRGIVMRSQTNDGSAGAASAEFELLIPSANLGDAMAAFSEIAEVRSRREATTDITAPTVGIAEHLEDSRARIDSLLAQLAAAETESEREAVEAELRTERSRSAALGSQLQNLERRANLSRVSLRIESDEAGAAPGTDGSWGIGDALHDAGRILAVGAAISLVALAVLGPIALLALLAWLAHRAWIRRSRRQALS